MNSLIIAEKKFYQTAKKIHGNKYDYSKVVYVNAKDNVIITCKVHGELNKHQTRIHVVRDVQNVQVF